MRVSLFVFIALAAPTASGASQVPPRLDIYNFDVNTGDATLLLTPDGRGVLIDAGDGGRGNNPINEFMTRAENDGRMTSLDFVIITHYDADHIGGADEVLNARYPDIAVIDRGNGALPRLPNTVGSTCKVGLGDVNPLGMTWGTAQSCSSRASCEVLEYMVAAEAGGRRRDGVPGEVITLDHGLELEIVISNATDGDGNTVNVFTPGRRSDCAANDLSLGVLVRYGDFRYLIAGDLTGDTAEGVADVEELLIDEAFDLDVYHVNHHGAETSSTLDFMQSITPTVAIVSNGSLHGHPRETVIENRIHQVTPQPVVYLTNFTTRPNAWVAPQAQAADLDMTGYDGILQIAVWRRSYRVFRWRDGAPITPGDRFFIKARTP